VIQNVPLVLADVGKITKLSGMLTDLEIVFPLVAFGIFVVFAGILEKTVAVALPLATKISKVP
jgi:hypothetical protein